MKRQTYMTVARVCVAATCIVSAGAVVMLSDASLRTFRKGSPLRIGYAVEPPYAFLTSAGEVTGEAPEIAKRISARLGIRTVTWRKVKFAALIDELEAGNIDVIAAGLFVTPERSKRVAFSRITFRDHAGLRVASGKPKRLHSCRQAADDTDIGCGAFASRKQDRPLRRAWGRELQPFLGSDDHLAQVARFGFATNDVLTGSATDKGKVSTHD